jgi:hypothetical protein
MATLDLVVLRHWPGFVLQADLYIAAFGVNVRFCRDEVRRITVHLTVCAAAKT